MNFFIRRFPTGGAVRQPPTSQKKFGFVDVAYLTGTFNKFGEEFLSGAGSALATQQFVWVESGIETVLTGRQVIRRLANTIDSLFVRCCYDISEYVGLHAELHEGLMPQILSRRGEAGFPILKWNFDNEPMSVKHSSLARSIILNTDSIVESIYLFSFFPFLAFVPAAIVNLSPSCMAKTLKNGPEKEFEFTDGAVFKEFQKMYARYAGWDTKNRKFRNYLVHMADLHTAVYSEPGKATAAFCCAFNDPEPIDDDLRLVQFEDLSESHQKLVAYLGDVVVWYRKVLGM